jgi:DNA-binding MarR family transcriptional regulator
MIVNTGVPLDTLPGYSLGQTYRMLRHAMDDALRQSSLTTPRWGALLCIVQNDGLSGADMARLHHVTPQTMNTILQNLEHHGMVVREPHPTSGTLLRVVPTDEGRRRLEEATDRVEAVQERMLSYLSPDERETLMDLLNRCRGALADSGLANPDGPPCVD